ncbi:hypothetical protein [Klebsiella variicola]|uniref:hypothetical protein n=1 Tax=Klebsiella variicola TaxID=244366 RepID=UPI0018611E70|nr:hypothetical protein [Klebsiella variicola]QNF10902.1 hypothetical protein DUZ89_15445 [Klebsiella variicola]
MALTQDELCQIACRFLQNNCLKGAIHERFVAAVSTGEQPDAIGFRNLASCLIEVKCSRADFLADRKKHFRVEASKGMGDWGFCMAELSLTMFRICSRAATVYTSMLGMTATANELWLLARMRNRCLRNATRC